MVALTFPDGARRDYPPHSTGLDIAKSISPSLAKRTVAIALDGEIADLSEKVGAERNDIVRAGKVERGQRGVAEAEQICLA